MQIHSDSLNLYYLFYKCRKKLSETTAGFWDDIEIYSALNESQQHIARKAKCLRKTVTVTTDGSQDYDLKDNSFADIIDIDEDGVYFLNAGTNYRPLKYTTKGKLNAKSPGWQGVAASTPIWYYYDKSSQTIGLHPACNSTNQGAYLFVQGYYRPKIILGGTASGGDATYITLPAGSSTVPYPNPTDDYYNNLWIEIYSGTGAGQRVEITDYVASTRRASATFATAPDNTSVFGMIPEIPGDAQNLMYLFTMADLLEKGGSRSKLSDRYWRRYYDGLGLFIGETIEADDESLIKDTYR